MRYTANQVVLGTFVATFVYCLLILRSIRRGGGFVFVPRRPTGRQQAPPSLRRPGAYHRRRRLHARDRPARDVADRESLHEYGEHDDAVGQ
jgi:hypothetical protein